MNKPNPEQNLFGRPKERKSAARICLMAERPDEFTDGINLLFNDASVEFRELRWATESLDFTNAQLPPPRPATAPLSIVTTSTSLSATTDASPSKPQRRHRHPHFQY